MSLPDTGSSLQPGQRVTVTDDQDEVVASVVAGSAAASLLVLDADLVSGSTYSVLTGRSTSATSTGGLSEVGTATAADASQAAGGPGGGRRGP